MNDQFNDIHPADGQETRAVTPVTPVVPVAPAASSGRRRRTERNRDKYEEAALDLPPLPTEEEPAVRPVLPRRGDEGEAGDEVSGDTRVQPRFEPAAPSQGVPRPSALTGHPRERGPEPAGPIVRRPVQADGYTPLPQLGNAPSPRPVVRRLDGEMPRRPQRLEPMEPEYEEEEEEYGRGRGLIFVIVALLIVAALVLGLIMIPEDDETFLGDIKRTVTEPLKELFSRDENDDRGPVSASGFTASVVQRTAPYKIIFNMVTSNRVTSVRVVEEDGSVIPTVTTLSIPNAEDTIVWQFELTLSEGYEGVVQAQIQDGENWLNTGLTQTLSIGLAAPTSSLPVVTTVPREATHAPTAPQASTAAPEAKHTATAVPAVVTDAPAAETEESPVVTPAPTVEATPSPTLEVTATPTLSVTATPTLVPTATPTAEPTAEPTEEPTPTPTEEPTPEPTATPVVTPRLEAMAADSVDPELIAAQKIYDGKKAVEEYERDKPINMPAGSEYLTRDFGVTTFRGNAFRQNAASGTVTEPTAMSLLWTAEAGVAYGENRNYHGIGWTGQPLITKWNRDVRSGMNLSDELKAIVLKEVIVAGYDGMIYFLNLEDGSVTRKAINLGYPMRGTPTLNPLGYPMMTVGQYARKMKSGTGKNIGLYYYNLMNQERLRLIDGIDRDLSRPYNGVGAFDTSALIDRNTNTLIAIGTNGMLYTETLSMKLNAATETTPVKYTFNTPEQVTMISRTKAQAKDSTGVAVESSLAMYGCYAFYADMDGVLRCVDTTTMTTAWAVETGDAVRAAIALDLDEETNTLWLYTANTLYSRSKGDVSIRRFNAMTGEEDWAFAIHCAAGKKKDVTFNRAIVPGAMASPVVGQHALNGLVYFTLSGVSSTGAQKLGGEAAMDGVIIALDKATGKVVWHKEMDAYCYSSPVAVYAEDGRGWIIQACSNGTLFLMDGLTGETINTLSVNGTIEGSPAVFYNTMVIGTTGKNTSYIYGIKLN